MASQTPIRLAAFDVDGTLLRGRTVCECIADGIGRVSEMTAFEQLVADDDIRGARETMAEWYREHDQPDLLQHLAGARFAPGLNEGFALLQEAGVKIALVSITWQFAVEALGKEWGADFAIGTELASTGVKHFWPADKAPYLSRLMARLDLPHEALAAVGDSSGDLEMLALSHRGYFVGDRVSGLPEHVMHWPGSDIAEIVRDMLRGQT